MKSSSGDAILVFLILNNFVLINCSLSKRKFCLRDTIPKTFFLFLVYPPYSVSVESVPSLKPMRIQHDTSIGWVRPSTPDAMVCDFVRVWSLVSRMDRDFWHCHRSFHSIWRAMVRWAFGYRALTNRDHFARFRIRSNWKRVVDDDHSGLMFG